MTNLLDYLEKTTDRKPDKTAFTYENEIITFSELRLRAKAAGTAIARKLGAIRQPVAVLSGHTLSDIIAFLGTLYSGNFYVPLDANAPAEYLEKRYASVPPAMIIDGGVPEEDIDEELLVSIRKRVIDADPAYAIFTSGSTGDPKAAVISHHAAIDLIEWLTEEFGFSEKTVFGGQNMFYFDASVTEIYTTLKCGSTTHILPKKLFISPLKVMRTLDELEINTIPWATAAIKLLANSGVFEKYIPKYLTDVIIGGENLPAKQLNIWRKALPAVRYTNVYGPTETTVDCSFYTVQREFSDSESIPIGYACANKELMLLDGDNLAAPGQPGEIVVRGIGVGLGYYNLADNNGFVQNPLNPHYRDIVYRTGDIGKINEYGELIYLSRKDGQVKHMGSRIELGEIEAAAGAVSGVQLVCCAYDHENSKILMFYQGAADSGEVTAALSASLPRYMRPNIVVKLENMPETPNGKIDRVRIKKEYYDKS